MAEQSKNGSNVSDEELVELVRSTDQERFTEIVQRYEQKLLRYASYLVRDDDAAADVVQNAFVKAFINLRGFNVKRRFSSWIYRIVHNEAMNHLKHVKRHVRLDDVHEAVLAEVDDHSDPHIVDMLRSCINELPLSYREPLMLYYLDDRSYGDISDILHLALGTVGTRITRGRRLLKTLYLKKTR